MGVCDQASPYSIFHIQNNMPNTNSAKKELRKAGKKTERNKQAKTGLKKLAKQSLKAIEAGDAKADELVQKTLKAYDKAAKKNIIKANTRDRKKSSLHKKLNSSKKEKK